MSYKQKIEIIHEGQQPIKGNEPFLSFSRPYMIVNLSTGGGSHIFFEGHVGSFYQFKKGDVLAFRLCRISRVEETWRDRVLDWVKGILKV